MIKIKSYIEIIVRNMWISGKCAYIDLMCLYGWMLGANNRHISLAFRFFDNRNSLSVMSRLLTEPSRQFIACSRHSSGLTCRGSRLLRVLRARIWRTLRSCFISGATLSNSADRNCQNSITQRDDFFYWVFIIYCQIQASRCNILKASSIVHIYVYFDVQMKASKELRYARNDFTNVQVLLISTILLL